MPREPLIEQYGDQRSLCADREDGKILLYISDYPEVTVEVTQAEFSGMIADVYKLTTPLEQKEDAHEPGQDTEPTDS